ncbi:MAG: alpha/beta hydrolase [Paenibacillus dendritiformis]|uniref:alpha/beta fold hydrolase n=1 Tax=Paenibacillus dendritiformis TaxID=130049 RepID=UPI001B012B0E|nr:alpha/beta hydrolase [Paenibacillus dendritiformis]MDU5144276.1 alpha/beta hydrolase [Paenibacillus dendritiformis]GIO73436.1 proline iminopeptidase [Paenibacillus dendritiformis]
MWTAELLDTARGVFEIFTQGQGEPLCIAHLYSEFNERGYYFADRFTEHFRVYLINLKEAGNSCKIKSEHELGMDETCTDLEAVREALGLEQWSYAGHSTGGMLGLVYAIRHPGSLTKMLVGGAAASNRYMEHEGSMYCPGSPLNARLRELFAIMKSAESTREERARAGREWTEMSLHKPEHFDYYFSEPSSGRVVQRRLDYYSHAELPNYDITGMLTGVLTPSIIYCGEHDTQCPLPFSQEIQEHLPNSQLVVFHDSNHFPYLEEKPLFINLVKEFRKL